MPVERDYAVCFDPCLRSLDKQGSRHLPALSLAHPPDIQDVQLRLTPNKPRLSKQGDDLANFELQRLCAAKVEKRSVMRPVPSSTLTMRVGLRLLCNAGSAYGASDNGVHALTQFANRGQASFILIAQGKMK